MAGAAMSNWLRQHRPGRPAPAGAETAAGAGAPRSLRLRLYALLVAATMVLWLCAGLWVAISARHDLRRVLDIRLIAMATIIDSLTTRGNLPLSKDPSAPAVEIPDLDTDQVPYLRRHSCQVWTLDGRLMAATSTAPPAEMTHLRQGLADEIINGEDWRVYALTDERHGVRILVGDHYDHQTRFIWNILRAMFLPGVMILPLLALLIWVTLGRGLRPLRLITETLSRRDGGDFSPLGVGRVPAEIAPVVESLNTLFRKLGAARDHERSLTAFAAHELRTPLAGLRTQVQIALAAPDQKTRDGALRQTLLAVDRMTRLVRQLLALARLDAAVEPRRDAWLAVGPAIDEVADELGHGEKLPVVVEPELFDCSLLIDQDVFRLVVRNLMENALQHSPDEGKVRWRLIVAKTEVALAVEDDGPGIPPEELGLVTERFYRGRHKTQIGSGLGLAMVELSLRQDGARLKLENRPDRSGLRAAIVVAPERLKRESAWHKKGTPLLVD
jgi:two-component system sensor histidine kinase QseC